MRSVFHQGEQEVQRRAGVSHMAARVGNGIHSRIPEAAIEFLAEQFFAVLGAADNEDNVWATLLAGSPGFLQATKTELTIDALPAPTDPLYVALTTAERPVGLLAIEPATRRRMRLNGTAVPTGAGLVIHTEQVYANCPKYIQKRELAEWASAGHVSVSVRRGERLTKQQQEWICRADTFFVATLHPEGGADASHRGGNPGFVRVNEAGDRLYWPDYAGNAMFNTLGNITAHPAAGLLFVDFEGTGDTLQITGLATVLWDEEAQRLTGAERGVAFTVTQVVETSGALPVRYHFEEYSRFNPTVEQVRVS